ncbi:uncharacterized protein LOC131291491 [Anopheles ziemanni]|uniref:uncharacterized protein LOC131291491 n=1 Tax=Anopheles ziemanni TaxID=345580 RepID=UPI00265FE9ED|nr:uncharacterized protein LOC131291491 [Anopheles ziemanni]
MAEQDGVYDEFEEVFYEASNRIEELLLAAESKTKNNMSAAAQVIIQQQPLKAPIPTFDGTYAAWPKFKAIFEDLMANAGDSDTMKLYHLEKALVGEAAGAIDVSILNAGNYKQAWEILTERFGNHRAIVDSHIHGLLNLKRMTSENFHELRALVQETSRHVESLRFLKQNLEGVSEPMVVHLLVSALDKSTRKAWEGTQRKGELPRYEQTMAFLKSRCQILENCAAASSSAPVVKLKGNHPLPPRHPAQKSYTAAVIQCEICGKDHPNINCPELLKGTPRERSNTAQKAGLCFNCLRKGHQLRECPSKRKCYKCQRRHHTLLHEDVAPTGQPTISMAAEVEPQPPTPSVHPPSTAAEYGGPVVREQLSTACASQTIKPSKNVLLLTAVVNVLDAKNQPHRCRVLLDSGSQVNFLAEEMANRLGLPKRPANVPIVGINALRTLARDKLTVTIQSRVNSYQTSLECLVTPKITGTIPSCNINIDNWDIPEGITFADPTFYTPDKVDLLIGAELFFDILKPSQLDLADNLPRLQDSQFGWIVSGAIVEQQATIPARYSHHALVDIEKMIQQFWQIEEVPDVPERSIEELECENHFLTTYKRDESGRFIMRLPFNKQQTLLNNGRTVALKRFMMLEKRLLRNPELQQQYVEFIREYETLGHCRQIRESDDVPNQLSYYLPHHAVLRPSSSSTKCRVVFDASAKASPAELSLNDVLHVGPVVQNDLYSIVLRFRMYKVAFSGDIAKMYRQILHAKEDQRFLRIFWRPHPSEPLRVFELCTVTYGTASAPFLATKCLLQFVEEDGDAFPIASRIIKEETYMDDVLSGADSVEEAIEAQHQLKRLLNQGGFPIRKWCSNSLEFLQHIPVEEQEKAIPMAERGVNQAIKVLGLLWDPKADHLYIAHQPKPVATADQRVTKLIIYSEVAKFFDPLGLVSPVIVLAKLLIQRLWKLKTYWNDPIDEGSMKQWQELQPSLQHLHRIQTQRNN